MLKENNSNFCVMPWKNLFIDTKGEMLPCCLFEKGDGFETFMVDHGVKNYLESSSLEKIKKLFLANKEPGECKVCFEHERLGLHSYRQGQNIIHEDSIEHIIEGSDNSVNSLDIRLGNKCNLKCSMCGPHSSKLILNDLVKENPDYKKSDEYINFNNIDWVENPKIWKDILNNTSNIKRIHMTGGEPLLIKEAFDFKKALVELGVSKSITLSYNTNLTKFNPEFGELWSHFQDVILHGSIDGVGDLNDYIRFPSQWEVIKNNILLMKSFTEVHGFSRIKYHITFQAFNLFSLDKIIDFILEVEGENFQQPEIFPLDGPPWFNVRYLPRAVKDQAADHYKEYLEEVETRVTPNIFKLIELSILPLVKLLKASDEKEEAYMSTLSLQFARMERIRDKSLLEIEPKLGLFLK